MKVDKALNEVLGTDRKGNMSIPLVREAAVKCFSKGVSSKASNTIRLAAQDLESFGFCKTEYEDN